MVIKINTLSFNTNNFLALIIEITSLKINDVSLYRIKTTSVWPEVRLKLCHVCMENKDMLISCSESKIQPQDETKVQPFISFFTISTWGPEIPLSSCMYASNNIPKKMKVKGEGLIQL